MKSKFLYLIAIVVVATMCSCVEIFDNYRVKIVNNSTQDISVYYTLTYGSITVDKNDIVNPSGPSIIISKGECFEYTLTVEKNNRDGSYVAFLFSDKEIDIDTDILNQEPDDSESRKLLFLKYSLWELIQMDCTVTFNGFENE